MTELGRRKEKANRTGAPFSPLSDAFHMTEGASEQERDEEIGWERVVFPWAVSVGPAENIRSNIFTDKQEGR